MRQQSGSCHSQTICAVVRRGRTLVTGCGKGMDNRDGVGQDAGDEVSTMLQGTRRAERFVVTLLLQDGFRVSDVTGYLDNIIIFLSCLVFLAILLFCLIYRVIYWFVIEK